MKPDPYKKHKPRNTAQKELIENYGGKSLPHTPKNEYKRKPKHPNQKEYTDELQ